MHKKVFQKDIMNSRGFLFKITTALVSLAFFFSSAVYAQDANHCTLRQISSAVEDNLAKFLQDGFAGITENEIDTFIRLSEQLKSKNIEGLAKADAEIERLISPTSTRMGTGTKMSKNFKKAIRTLVEPKAGQPKLRVIKAQPEKKRNGADKPAYQLPLWATEKIARKISFDINNKHQFLELVNEIFPQAVLRGLIKPVVLINIKLHNQESSLAYGKYLHDISAKFNGNITFILSVEDKTDLKHDMCGMSNLINKATDLLGEDFIKTNLVLTMLDGGMKERWANLTPRYGQSGIGPARRGDSYIEQNINTLGALHLAYPGFGYDDFSNIASDSDVILGNAFIGNMKPKDLPKDRRMVIYGIKRPVLNETEFALIKSYISSEKSWDYIFGQNAVKQILKTIKEEKLLDQRGLFLMDKDGKISYFAEKPPADEILKAIFEYAEGIGEKEGYIYENLWLITYNKDNYIKFAKKLENTPVTDALKKLSDGRITNLSQLEVSVFQMVLGSRFMDDAKWNAACKKLLEDKTRPLTKDDLNKLREIINEFFPLEEVYGADYGEGCEAVDTGNLINTVEVWEREKGMGKTPDSIVEGGAVLTMDEGVTFKGSLIYGKGRVIIQKGAVIENSAIFVHEGKTITIPPGADILDSFISDNVKFSYGGSGKYLVAGLWVPPRFTSYELNANGEWEPAKNIIIYPDESITTNYYGNVPYIVRDIISTKFKGEKIGKIISEKDWKKWVDAHPNILGVKGVSGTWDYVKDKEFIQLCKYPGGNDVKWARENADLFTQQLLTINLRQRIRSWWQTVVTIDDYFKTKDKARDVLRMYRDADAVERAIIQQVIDSRAFSDNRNARSSARWVLGRLIAIDNPEIDVFSYNMLDGVDIQDMLKDPNKLPESVYIYIKYLAQNKEGSKSKELDALEKIVDSSLKEDPDTILCQSANWLKNTMRRIIDRKEQTKFSDTQGKYVAVSKFYDSDTFSRIAPGEDLKGLWTCLYIIMVAPEKVKEALLDLLNLADKDVFRNQADTSKYEILEQIAIRHQITVDIDNEQWQHLCAACEPGYERVIAGIMKTENDGFNDDKNKTKKITRSQIEMGA
ncbi:MAG: hypothetical protein V2A72_01035 [Candidatus Omnitrophota bacterium]